MAWPQIIFLALTLLGLGINMGLHGERQNPHNFWTALFGSVVSVSLLYWGGFFNCWF